MQFCAANDTPVSKSKPVMMAISSTVYRVMLERVASYQESLITGHDVTAMMFTIDLEDR